MPEKYHFLLVSNSPSDPWVRILQEVVTSLGSLQIASKQETIKLVSQRDYDLLVVDAAKVEDVFCLVSSIREQQPDARILVVTTSPTWRRAREAFRAGATDYIRKSMNKTELLCILQATMDKIPPMTRRLIV